MTDSQITINKDSLIDIKRKLVAFKEESEEYLSNVERSVLNAELEGWNDSRYDEFRDKFMEVKQIINNEHKRIEEELLPFLKKTENAFDSFVE
jgi:hypothetical protein